MLDSILTTGFLASVLAATIRLATPILIAALGEIFTQRAGILNLGLEGTMTIGAAAAFIGAYFTNSLLAGLLLAILCAMLYSLIMAWLSVTMRTNQVIAGTAMTILGVGLAAYVYRTIFGIKSLPPQVTAMASVKIPLLSDIPILGPALFDHNLLVYFAFLLVLLTGFVLHATVFGLNVKAVGENPRAADSKGINVARIRYFAVLIGGAFAGLGGAFMSVAYMNSFTDTMITGRGFIAVAVVVFARWQPARAMWGALLFGFASALQMRLQAVGVQIPNQFLLMLPYVLTILVLIGVSKKAEFPSAYTKPYARMER